MYIFPGVGLGAVVSKAEKITDRMFYLASQELARFVSQEDLSMGKVYPDITKIRKLSERIAVQGNTYFHHIIYLLLTRSLTSFDCLQWPRKLLIRTSPGASLLEV